MPEPGEPAVAESARAVDDELVPKLTEVVNAALGVGAALVRTIAQATTSCPLPPPGERPLEDIARYGTTAVGSLLGLVVDGARSSSRTAMAANPRRGRQPNTKERPGPEVTAGSTLRVPLLIENTSPSATPEITFAAAEIERVDFGTANDGASEAEAPDTASVTFTPRKLVIAPRDFEKLTVRIPTSDVTTPGRYRVRVEGGGGWFATEIVFDVVSPATPKT